MGMKVELIGSGGWDGVPSTFCRCSVCKSAINETQSNDRRTRPLLKISGNDGNFCLDIGPDFRDQSSRFNLEVDTFFVSHWHHDHLFGIYELGAWFGLKLNKKPVIHCSQGTADYIKEHMGFMDLEIRVLNAYEPIDIYGVTVTPLPTHHMRSIDEEKSIDELDTLGFMVDDGHTKIAYLADYYKLPEKTQDIARQCNLVVADGTYLLEDQYPNETLRNAFREFNDPDHMHGNNILTFTKSLKVPIVFHSNTHLPEMSHENMQKMMPDNHTIGFDGMDITHLLEH